MRASHTRSAGLSMRIEGQQKPSIESDKADKPILVVVESVHKSNQMKKLFLTLGFTIVALLTHAQGDIQLVNWGNGALTRIIIEGAASGPFIPVASDGFAFSLYYGPPGSTAEELVPATPPASIGDSPGILTGARAVLPPFTDPNQVITVQVRLVAPSQLSVANPPLRQVTLGQLADPGAGIWTSDPSSRTFYIVPEPSSLALAAVGGILFAACRWERRCQRDEA